MYRSGGLAAIVLIIGSIFYLATGLWKLSRFRKYKELFISLVILLVGVIVIYLLFSTGWKQPSGNQRIWFAAPGMILFLIWMLSGFFARQYVENVLSPKENSGLRNASKKPQIVGLGSLFVSISIWCYGAINPLSNRFYIWGMLLCLVSLIFGLGSIVKNTRLDDKQ